MTFTNRVDFRAEGRLVMTVFGQFVAQPVWPLVVGFAMISGACAGDDGAAGPQGEPGPPGASGSEGEVGETGRQGEAGPPGRDGSLSAYGDGSAGDVEFTGFLNFFDDASRTLLLPNNNYQFRNVRIDSDAVIVLPSGFVFRCTGTFTNEGRIIVSNSENGGLEISDVTFSGDAAGSGVALSGGQPGEVADTPFLVPGGRGGVGLGLGSYFLLNPTLDGGSGGAGTLYQTGSSGGGSLWIFAAGAVVNSGSIEADGGESVVASGGGGGGGVIVIASRTSITNTPEGAMRAEGNEGSLGVDFDGSLIFLEHSVAPSGGGGGGIIHLLAPEVSSLGTISVAGGDAGRAQSVGAERKDLRVGGAGGGAGGGNGGEGGSIQGNSVVEAQPGTDGQFIVSEFDPTALL
ncbi:MAG: hypothetical protein AAFP04_01830 [Myxococcota bacterium]